MKNNNNTLLALKAKTVVILLFLIVVKSLPAIGQTRVTRYTPLSSPVTAYNQMPGMSSSDKNNWSSYVQMNYPLATELNVPSATNNFNCHGYAWHVSGGSDQVWIGLGDYDPNPYIMEDIYWEDGSYIRLNSETGADKISYYNGNHSAIQTSTTGTYHSKWGIGPLMEHSRDYGPAIYQMNYRYYYDEPVISGDNILCYPSSKTYSIQDFYDVTYNWSTSSNLQINGSNSNRSVNISPKSSSNSSGFVQVSIFIPAYNKTRVITKNVWVGVPTNPTDIMFFPYNPCLNQIVIALVSPVSPAASGVVYEWGNTHQYIPQNPSGSEVHFTTYPSFPYTTYVFVKGTNACGSSVEYSELLTVSKCGGGGLPPQPVSVTLTSFIISPNPASSEITISQNENNVLLGSEFDRLQPKMIKSVKIIDNYGTVQIFKTYKESIYRTVINISNLNIGAYIILINEGEDTESHNLIKN